MKRCWLVLCGVLVGCASENTPLAQPQATVTAAKPLPPPEQPAFPTLPAAELQRTWETNRDEVAAKYQGKVIALTGMIHAVNKESAGYRYFVTFDDPSGYFVNGADDRGAGWRLVDILCYFDHREQVAELHKDRPVKIIGEVAVDNRIRMIHCRAEDAFNPGI